MTNARSPRIGEVYMMTFTGSDSEQSGFRPGLIIQNNTGNLFSPNIIALPFTTSIKKTGQPTHVFVSSSDSGLKKDSMVLCENPECISKCKLGRYVTTLSPEYMEEIAQAFILATSVISFISPDILCILCQRAADLNAAYDVREISGGSYVQ